MKLQCLLIGFSTGYNAENLFFCRFSDLLHHLEQQMEERNCPDFLTHNIYLTRGWDANFARTVALHEEEQVDVVTGKLHY